ncbi:MAG: biosynthetic-type acetolactate synthase large subunit [Candidatus Euphemobacter frigidus]|nr:biosynthetic-type acetolactate synthase large subunit [Candidatus Euphemobacter frigidus]MDP8275769.1 biosynthetic-type acetolactate synthase large subunit [Candidatus Euphemobacter frigidus]
MKGAKLFFDCLVKEGVEVMFGYPGGAVIDIFDELDNSPIRFILTRHEQGAAHAADGYARASGKVGVCIATSGPGGTNLVTGIATAYMDSIPMVAFTGQVPTSMIGNDAFQEADIVGITRPITKHNYLVTDVNELPGIIKEAFFLAGTGRCGPVLVDIPKDIQQAQTSMTYPNKAEIPGYSPVYTGHPKQIEQLAKAIKQASRPILYVGGGAVASGAAEELRKLVAKTSIPVTTTLMALGVFPETDPVSLGMLGMHGTKYANYAIMDSDLLIAVGARFDDRITGKISEFAPHAKVAHIDIDPTSLKKNVRVDIPVVGDVRRVLKDLNKIVKPGQIGPWLKQISQWKKKFPLTYESKGDIRPQYVIEQIHKMTGGRAIITTEVGQNQMWAAQFYTYTEPRTFLSSGGLGTMGYGLPAAIGAQVACPDRVVFDIAGDGSIQMNIQELTTAVTNSLPVKVAILNNGYLGMVRQWQELFYKKNYAGTVLVGNPDFVKLAEAYGAGGIRVTEKKEVVPALKKALKYPGPVLIDFRIAPEENVWPMVPAGVSIRQMMSGLA